MQIIIASASHDERARVVPPLSRNIQLTRTTLLYGSRVQKFEIAISNGPLPHLDRCISTNLHRPITPPSHFSLYQPLIPSFP